MTLTCISLFQENCPSAFTPTNPEKPKAGFIDGQIQLMKPNGIISWDQFIQCQFVGPIKRMLVCIYDICICIL